MTDRLAHFDRLYTADRDPWRYETCPAEAFKRRVVLRAAARGGGRLLELGCGPGVATAEMAPWFARVTALDGARGAVRIAQDRVACNRRVEVRRAVLPAPLPPRRFDAAIATETLYYLPHAALTETLRQVRRALRPGGVFVSTHALHRFGDAAVSNAQLTALQASVFGAPLRTLAGAGWRLDAYRPRPA